MLLFSATWTVQRPGYILCQKKIKNVAGVYPVIPLSYRSHTMTYDPLAEFRLRRKPDTQGKIPKAIFLHEIVQLNGLGD